MSSITSYLARRGCLRATVIAGFALFKAGFASAQPTNSGVTVDALDAGAQLPPALNPDSPVPASQGAAQEPIQPPTSPEFPATSSAPVVPNSGVSVPSPPQAQPVLGANSAQPLELSRDVFLRLIQLKLLKRDRRVFTFGVGPLLLVNTHWLDQPSDRSVSVGTLSGVDNQYPGFVGFDAALGLMLDVRYLHVLGVELDLFLQNDRGTGTINVEDAGSICFIPGLKLPVPTRSYEVTIGQTAWHVPLLFKLSLPGRWERVVDGNGVEHETRQNFGTLAFGPEFVFPRSATFEVRPATGLDHPDHAFASSYVMYTGALGFERRLLTSHDMRLLFSLRGSYNPSAGDSVMKRVTYDSTSGNIVALAYRSEWRYQAALTLGLGWFF